MTRKKHRFIVGVLGKKWKLRKPLIPVLGKQRQGDL